MNKSVLFSKTVIGAVIAAIGGILALVGPSISHGTPIPWGEVIAILGGLLSVVGARGVAGRIADK